MQTVLVVEDEVFIRFVIVEDLRDAGFATVEAGNADEAIAILEARQDIQLVFTDVDMPGSMNGAKLAAAVRDRWPPVHIVITSGKAMPILMPVHAVFIPKPYTAENVVAVMRKFETMV